MNYVPVVVLGLENVLGGIYEYLHVFSDLLFKCDEDEAEPDVENHADVFEL